MSGPLRIPRTITFGRGVCPTLAGLVLAIGCHHVRPNPIPAGLGRPSPGITVVGNGEASAKPDIARIHLGVESSAVRASEAVAQASKISARLIEILKQAGIADSDLRTTGFSIHRDRAPEPLPADRAAREPPQYRASNMLVATVRNLDRIGTILDQAVSAGANQAWGLEFDLADREPLRTRARQQAMEDARRTAEQLASHAGVSLGPIVSILELQESGGPPPRYDFALKRVAESVPIEVGQMKLQEQLQVVFALDR